MTLRPAGDSGEELGVDHPGVVGQHVADGGRLQQRRPHLGSDGRLQIDAKVLLVELVGVLEPAESGGGRRLGEVLASC